jgi:hypothetical protein
MTAWQTLCARLADQHRRDSTGRCKKCRRAHPCALAAMAAPVKADASAPRFLAFAKAPSRPNPAPGHRL